MIKYSFPVLRSDNNILLSLLINALIPTSHWFDKVDISTFKQTHLFALPFFLPWDISPIDSSNTIQYVNIS